jgi:hypothetical protein
MFRYKLRTLLIVLTPEQRAALVAPLRPTL